MSGDTRRSGIPILHLEADANDAARVAGVLARDAGGYEITRVASREALLAALEEQRPAVVLADYRWNAYPGPAVLTDVRMRDPIVPFIFVSEEIGGEEAVAALTNGATDYVRKDRLDGLATAVRRALAPSRRRGAGTAEEPSLPQPTILATTREAIIIQDLQRRVTYWNAGAERIYEMAASEVLGRDIQDLLQFGSPRELAEARTTVSTDGAWAGVLHQRNARQKDVTVQSSWTLLRDESDQPRSILVVARDITTTSRLEAKFLRLQRLESLGFLVNGIAHDLNNVLAPMVVALQVLRDKIGDERRHRMLDVLDASTSRAAGLVRQVLTFARGTQGERILVQPAPVLREMEKMLRESLPKGIEIEVEVGPEAWNIRADPTQLHQVLLNLCINARDAIPGAGTICIRAVNMMLEPSYMAMKPESRPGPYVVFSVSDTGVGMPPEVLERVFDPFFSTKEPGRGTGVGLSTVAAIARSHEGFVEVDSTPGAGSTFKVYLPARPTSPILAAAALIPPALGHGETILFVDDEEPVREILGEALEKAGYTVITAADGAEAVALYARQRAHPAAVVLDMHMPVMDGVTTLHALSRIDPRVRVVAISGLGENELLAKQAGARAFVPKPFTIHNLLHALQQAIGAEN